MNSSNNNYNNNYYNSYHNSYNNNYHNKLIIMIIIRMKWYNLVIRMNKNKLTINNHKLQKNKIILYKLNQ